MSAAPIGKFVWYEYMGTDLPAAVDFYTHVVRWTAQDGGMSDFAYQIVSAGSHMVGGMMTIPADAKAMGARPSWLGYIWVENVDLALPKLMEAGGKVFKAPSDIPGIGRFAVVADPYGGTFMLFRDAGGNPPPPPAGERRARSAGTNCTATTAPRRSTSIATSLAGRRPATSTWGRWVSIGCSRPVPARKAGS